MKKIKTNFKKDQYVLNDDRLLPGDIILTTTVHKISKLIRIVTRGEYSHAMLYVGGQSCIDSTGSGVQAHNTQRMLFESPKFCKVLRYKDPIPQELLESVLDYVRTKVGTAYSIPEAIHAGLKDRKYSDQQNRQFCSRLVAQAYYHNGMKLVNSPDYSSPEEINKSDKLIEVENPLRFANPDDIAKALEVNTILDTQEKSINYIFQESRKLTGFDIQTFEQIGGVLHKFPNLDDGINKILIDSGFLELWKKDLENNPWFYDYERFVEHFESPYQRKEIGQKQSLTEIEIKRRFEKTLSTLQSSFAKKPLKSFQSQIELYEKLIELSDTRAKVWALAKR